jgi:hypothetical protein
MAKTGFFRLRFDGDCIRFTMDDFSQLLFGHGRHCEDRNERFHCGDNIRSDER